MCLEELFKRAMISPRLCLALASGVLGGYPLLLNLATLVLTTNLDWDLDLGVQIPWQTMAPQPGLKSAAEKTNSRADFAG
jgi:hypothetical protein